MARFFECVGGRYGKVVGDVGVFIRVGSCIEV